MTKCAYCEWELGLDNADYEVHDYTKDGKPRSHLFCNIKCLTSWVLRRNWI